jgi:PAS domain S-box-containing protein
MKSREQLESELTAARQRLAELENLSDLLENITDAVPALIAYIDKEQRYQFCNRMYESWFGVDPAGLTGKHIKDLLGEEGYEAIEEYVKEALSGQIVAFESWVTYKEGDRYVSATYIPDISETGEVKGFSALVTDITDKKEIEHKLIEQTETVETINSIGQILSAELELKKLVQAVTDAATELTGAKFGSFFYNDVDEKGEYYSLYSISGVPREHFAHFPMPRNTDLFGPTFRGENVIRLDDVKKDPRYGKNSPYYGIPPGHLPVTSYLAVPVVSRLGEVLGGLFFGHPRAGVFTERAERIVVGLASQAAIAIDNARLFQRVQEAKRAAEEANRIKDEFLATVSHELRTPLTAMLGWVRLLRSGKLDDPTSARAIETIERNVKSQAQLIEDLLDISRITTGKLRLDMQPLEVERLIKAAVDAIRPAAEAKNIRIRMVLDSMSDYVSGDFERLQQVLWNLLSNAIKFSPRGESVQIKMERTDSHIDIEVSDRGQGIKPEFLPYIFNRFSQADSSINRSYGGLGLGLAIVKHLVELHGGTVEAASEGTGRGATFKVSLPILILEKELDHTGHVRSQGWGKESFALPTSLIGLRILAVDDEPDTIEMLKTIFEQCRAEVRTATSVTQAIEILDRWNPDVLISDIGMPDQNGYDLIREVRTRAPKQGGNIPAVALTAYARVEDRVKTLTAGYQMHVPKPIEPEELITIVANLTGLLDKRGEKTTKTQRTQRKTF